MGGCPHFSLGSTVKVFVKDGGNRFKYWKAPGTMIGGSGERRESFVVTGPVTVEPAEREEVSVLIQRNGGPAEVLATELEGTLVELPAGQIEAPGQNGDGGFSLASGWTMAGHEGAPIKIYTGVSPGPSRRANMGSSGGGRTLGIGVSPGHGHQIAVMAGSVAIAAVTAQSCMYYGWNYRGYPRVGYAALGRYYGELLSACLASATASAEFVKLPELKLEVEVEGDGSPQCAGYVKADTAKKYYGAGELVTLTATAFAGYVHTGWTGDGVAWLGVDQHGELEEPAMALKDITESEIHIQISDATPPELRTVTAVFEKPEISEVEPPPIRIAPCSLGTTSEPVTFGTDSFGNTLTIQCDSGSYYFKYNGLETGKCFRLCGDNTFIVEKITYPDGKWAYWGAFHSVRDNPCLAHFGNLAGCDDGPDDEGGTLGYLDWRSRYVRFQPWYEWVINCKREITDYGTLGPGIGDDCEATVVMGDDGPEISVKTALSNEEMGYLGPGNMICEEQFKCPEEEE